MRARLVAAWWLMTLVPIAVIVHEAGHFIAGERVGLRTRRVVLGRGPVVRVLRVRGRRVEVRRGLLDGRWGSFVRWNARGTTWGTFLVGTLGGPVASLAWLAVLVVAWALAPSLWPLWALAVVGAVRVLRGCTDDARQAWVAVGCILANATGECIEDSAIGYARAVVALARGGATG